MTTRWDLPSIRESTYPTPPDLTERRNGAASLPPGEFPAGMEVRAIGCGGVPCVVCEPAAKPQMDSRQTVVYFHGGGYRLGSAERSAPFGARIAVAAGATVYVVEYRLAPENPFPAGLHDAAAVYGHLLDQGRSDIVLAGDSAGGGLAAALTVAAAQAGLPRPGALVLMSPWLDLTCQAGTYTTRADTDQLFSLQSAQQASAMYLQGHDPTDPLVSPVRAPLDGWPPCLVFVSTDEVLLDDSLTFAAGLALARVPVASYVEPGVPHAWPAVFPDLPASVAAVRTIGSFLTHTAVDELST
jgi:epsilon-lactone hydrolase